MGRGHVGQFEQSSGKEGVGVEERGKIALDYEHWVTSNLGYLHGKRDSSTYDELAYHPLSPTRISLPLPNDHPSTRRISTDMHQHQPPKILQCPNEPISASASKQTINFRCPFHLLSLLLLSFLFQSNSLRDELAVVVLRKPDVVLQYRSGLGKVEGFDLRDDELFEAVNGIDFGARDAVHFEVAVVMKYAMWTMLIFPERRNG